MENPDIPILDVKNQEPAYSVESVSYTHLFLDGMTVEDAKEAIIEYLEKNGLGEKKVITKNILNIR